MSECQAGLLEHERPCGAEPYQPSQATLKQAADPSMPLPITDA